MSIKVSVVIPVYNAEKFIAECIQSLLIQTLKECEFIFVNDGSLDRSGEIIEEYQKSDGRILLFNQENQGVSTARNNGLDVAVGQYIGFVDADDFIEKDMYEKLYNTALENDADIVISNYESELEGQKFITKYPFTVGVVLKKDYIKQKVLPYFIEKDDLNTACNKIYREKLIKNNNIKFPANVSLGEDGMFNICSFSHATTIKYIDYTGYHYREVKGSATRDILQKDYFKRALEVYNSKWPELYLDELDKNKLEKKKAIKLINSVMSYIHIYFTPSNDLTFRKRYRYVSNMLENENVQKVLPIFYDEKYSTLGRYEKVLVELIKKQSALGLFFITVYSRSRNK
jgi:glycosyltransferase involved in cell wall biosynthesis